MTGIETSLWDLTETYLAAERIELDDLMVSGKGQTRTLKILVDSEQGVDLDRIAEISRGLSRLYDAEYDPDGQYQLEVSSPGLERSLKRPRHFEKSVGREVVLKGRDPQGTVATRRGLITEFTGETVTVDADGESHRYPLDSVISARTVFRWESSPKPGK